MFRISWCTPKLRASGFANSHRNYPRNYASVAPQTKSPKTFTPEELERAYKYLLEQRKRKQQLEVQFQQQQSLSSHGYHASSSSASLSSTATVRRGFVPLESGVKLNSLEELVNKVAQTKLRRAWFYVPASDPHKIEKSSRLGLDVVCFDLEDGVASNQKQQARQNIIEALKKLDFGSTEVFVRINKVGSGLELDDLKTVFTAVRPQGLLIPKVESAKEVQSVCKILADIEGRHHVQAIINNQAATNKKPGIQTFGLMCGIETAKGICNLNEIAQSDIRMEGLIFGAEDYAANIGAKRTRAAREVSYARSAILNHCAAYELQAIDMLTLDFMDTKQVEEEAVEGAEMGFAGKQAIHPNQIVPIHNAFSPSKEDIAESQEIFQAFINHQILGQGAFQLKGRMIDMPVALNAAKILQRALQLQHRPKPENSGIVDQKDELYLD